MAPFTGDQDRAPRRYQRMSVDRASGEPKKPRSSPATRESAERPSIEPKPAGVPSSAQPLEAG
jgi:hypothetical protein